MLRAYKYRLYPTNKQVQQIEQHFGACRLVWNLALNVKQHAWQSQRVNISRFDLQKQLVDLKEQYSWLYDINAQSLQAVLLNLDTAYKNFFSRGGFPKYKKKHGVQSFQCPGNKREVDFNKHLLTIPKIAGIPIRISRQFEGNIKTVTISRTTTGKYFASILVDDRKSAPAKKELNEVTAVGVDVGIKDFAILSNGTTISNPKYLKNNLKRLKCLQRRVSRKKKGSANRKKAIKRLAIQHERIVNMRKDFAHKVSHAITKQYDTVCMEDLNVSGMVKNRKLAQAISDAGWSSFMLYVQYKQEWKGGHVLTVPRFYASSKTCHICQHKHEALTLTERQWQCDGCSTVHERDMNAAINIKQYFFTRRGTPVEPVELSRLREAMKQEVSN